MNVYIFLLFNQILLALDDE